MRDLPARVEIIIEKSLFEWFPAFLVESLNHDFIIDDLILFYGRLELKPLAN